MKILLTGASGQLGSEIQELSKHHTNHEFYFANSKECDITDKKEIEKIVESESISVIINCAAYTAVDNAEEHEKRARAVNTEGVRNLVEVAEEKGIRLIHISTDYVFDGSSRIPYDENAAINPIGVYGRTKAEGEKYILNALTDAIVIRTSWVFSAYGSNFVKTMIRLMNEKDELKIVSDQFGSPTYARDLAHLCLLLATNEKPISQKGKIYHFCNSGITNWFEFAQEIATLTGKSNFNLKAIPTSEYPTKAQRPVYSVLATEKIRADFSITIRSWKEALSDCIRQIKLKENAKLDD